MEKRDDYISWDEYFMLIATVSAMRSKDPNTQVGACVVNPDHRIVGVGYNGFPNGCSDDDFPWSRQGEDGETKYAYVVHAEANAILNSSGCRDGRVYTTMFPCHECAKILIQAGVKEVIYFEDKYHSTWQCIAARRMLDAAGVTYRHYSPIHTIK